MKFSNGETLKKDDDFRLVYKSGKSIANKFIVMYTKKNNLGYNRVGFCASKKVGNSVVRNRMRRYMRESYRLNCDRIGSGYDIVFLARIIAKDCTSEEIKKAMLHLFRIGKI